MSMFEAEHPIAEKMKTISAALDDGLVDSSFMPAEMSLSYISPIESVDGTAKINFVDAQTENAGVIIIPVFTNPQTSTDFNVMNRDGTKLTSARIFLTDIKLRDFPISIGDNDLPSKYIQFDLVEKGVIFSAKPNGSVISSMGRYESALYDSWNDLAEEQGSIKKLHAAALMHLAA